MLDMAITGGWANPCPENKQINTFLGQKAKLYAGGAGNVATILTEQKSTVDLYTDGPGNKSTMWISELFKSVVRVNRIVWSNENSLPLKIRGYDRNEVVSRIDAEQKDGRRQEFAGLAHLASIIDDYDVVVISDYCKSVVDNKTEPIIQRIIRDAKYSIVDSKRRNYDLWRGASVLVPNRDEAEFIYGTQSATKIVKKAGVKAAVVTRDGLPAIASVGDKDIEIAFSRIANPYNVGAGDAFTAGVAIGLCHFGIAIEAFCHAIEAAGKYVERERKNYG
jgi:D-beta-D-heptose 7-phosphate kinase / D-beta-D-heptose 1-phosphate adenosyltransferase